MTFPVAAAWNGSGYTDARTSHTINLPAGITAGQLLVVQILFNNSATIFTFPAGWVTAKVTTDPFQNSMVVAYKVAEAESGTITVTSDLAVNLLANAWRITGHGAPGHPPSVSAGVTGSTAAPNPPLHTPSYGTSDYLWMAMAMAAGPPSVAFTGYPSNYPDERRTNSLFDNDTFAVAHRSLRGASDDPATFAIAGSNEWVAITVAIPPPGGGAHAQVIG